MSGIATAASIRESPELRAWVELCQDTRRALAESAWGSVTRAALPLAAGAPLLADAVLAIDVVRASAWLRDLFTRAAAAGGPAATLRAERLSGEHVVELLGAAVTEQAIEIESLARDLGADPEALGPIASLAAVPLLHAARHALESTVPPAWVHGYCPVCGAWPTLAEARGVERTRQYRCGRCGSGWFAGWLRCPYCDNADHRRAAALVGDDDGARHRVEVCEVCHGYVKTLTVLLPLAPGDLQLADADSVTLDLAAVAHGYRRPPPAGHIRSARIVADRQRS